MFIRVKPKANNSKSVQIIESFRTGGSVRQVIIRHVGVAKSEEQLAELKILAEAILRKLKDERISSPGQAPLFGDEALPESEPYVEERVLEEDEGPNLGRCINDDRVVDGSFEVMEWLFENLGLSRIFTNTKRDGARVKVLKQCIGGMLSCPSSKRGLASWLARYSVESPSLDSIYRFMDAFCKKKTLVKELVRKSSESLTGDKIRFMLYDVTTLYFESFEEDELRQSGYSKDNKFKETQVVLALATTSDGLPMWYETYPGKKWEGSTFADFVDEWRERTNDSGHSGDGVVAADSGMFSQDNLDKLRGSGLNYVLGARIKNLPASETNLVLDRSLFKELKLEEKAGSKKPVDEKEKMLYQVIELEDGTRLLVTWSSVRARKNIRDRERQIERVKKKLDKSEKLKGSSAVSNRGTMRYMKLVDGEKENNYVIDEEKVAADAKWDGLRGIITDLPLSNAREVRDALDHYHSLWCIEESFRINKSDLKIRPIYHWTKARIEAHILLCYLAFACLRYLQRRVQIQQGERMSPGELREAILGVESSILRDGKSGKVYRLPKRLPPLSKKLYSVLGLKHDTRPRELFRVSPYYERRHLHENAQAFTENEGKG